SDAVVDFLLRPDPDITEKALAKQFWTEHVQDIEDRLVLKASLSSDAAYGRFLSADFYEEFKLNRPASLDKLKTWVDAAIASEVDLENPMTIEAGATTAGNQFVTGVKEKVTSSLMSFARDPKQGYAFLCEWLEELMTLGKQKIAQLP